MFYEAPRLVTHIDDPAIAALTKYYSKVFPPSNTPGISILDMCSSWVRHPILTSASLYVSHFSYHDPVCGFTSRSAIFHLDTSRTGWLDWGWMKKNWSETQWVCTDYIICWYCTNALCQLKIVTVLQQKQNKIFCIYASETQENCVHLL